jgi:hypothetical protein
MSGKEKEKEKEKEIEAMELNNMMIEESSYCRSNSN